MTTTITIVYESGKRVKVSAVPIADTPFYLNRSDDAPGHEYTATHYRNGINVPFFWSDAIKCYYDVRKWYMQLPVELRKLIAAKEPNVEAVITLLKRGKYDDKLRELAWEAQP